MAVVALGGCVWPSVGFDSARTGSNPIEAVLGLLGRDNVGQLAPAWMASTGSTAGIGSPVVDFDRVYVEGTNTLFALSARTGTLLWQATLFGVGANGAFPDAAVGPDRSVYPIGLDQLDKFTPTGQFLWRVTLPFNFAAIDMRSPTVSGGLVFVGYSAFAPPPHLFQAAGFAAFDAATGDLRFMTTDGTTGEPTVAGGRVFQGNQPDGSIAAYDAKGKTNCTIKAPFTVPTCEPLSRYVMVGSGAVTPSDLFGPAQTPTGTGGRVAAADPSGCTETVCPTLWTSDISDSLSGHLATDGTTVFATTAEGNLVAFSASGCGAATCTPIWTGATSSGGLLSASIANGVVYAGGVEDGRVYAFDADGCGTTTCSPIWQSAPGAHIFTTPAVALGTVYIGRADGTLTAYRVPPQAARNRR